MIEICLTYNLTYDWPTLNLLIFSWWSPPSPPQKNTWHRHWQVRLPPHGRQGTRSALAAAIPVWRTGAPWSMWEFPWYPYLYLCLYLSTHPFILPSIYPSIHPSLPRSLPPSLPPSIHPSIHLMMVNKIWHFNGDLCDLREHFNWKTLWKTLQFRLIYWNFY